MGGSSGAEAGAESAAAPPAKWIFNSSKNIAYILRSRINEVSAIVLKIMYYDNNYKLDHLI
jgi:hypothetical protein